MTRKERKLLFEACGARRKANRNQIRAALLHNNTSETQIAKILGITSQAVSRAISGHVHTPAILAALRGAGVPDQFLFDPRKVGIADE